METVSKVTAGTSIRRWLVSAFAILLLFGLSISAGEPPFVGPVTINWGEKEFTDLSGIGTIGKRLVVCNDESHHSVHVLELRNGGYKYLDNVRLSEGEDELDLEGIACDKNVVYVIGSHSRNKHNERKKARERVYRFELGPNGKLRGAVDMKSLREVIIKHSTLEPASHKKPKEGGIDIEGIAVHDVWLYAGFRGPLDRGDALVLKFRFENPAETAQLLTIDLGGLGVRDLTRVADGFLILAGPMDNATGPYQLHQWDGRGGPAGKTRRLCTIPANDGAKAEGLAVLREDQAAYEFLILYDGPKGGDPKHIRLKK
jgi:hypothetical protein